MKMKMGYLLECRWPDRMPKAHSFVWKSSINGASQVTEGCHKRGAGCLVQIADITYVLSRYHQRVPGMKLSNIDECHCQLVRIHNTRETRSMCDFAEYAIAFHGRPLRSFKRCAVEDSVQNGIAKY